MVTAVRLGKKKRVGIQRKETSVSLGWTGDVLSMIVRMKVLAKVRLCRMMKISSIRNNREDFLNHMCSNV